MSARQAGAKRAWAWPLVPVYAAALAVKNGLRAAGVLRTRWLGLPVVSVGSLSAGGAGKTPVVMALAELLRRRGWEVDVLTRGYGRSGLSVERVNVDVEQAAGRFGDEPTLIARKTGVPVWVGADRFAAGDAAEAGAGTAGLRGVHLLDDGFQHRGLARSVDIVLVTEVDLEDALLPAGNLREPLKALRRADVVVVREDELDRVHARVRKLMQPGKPLWTVRRELRFPDGPGWSGSGGGARPLAFCAIARPEGFWQMLVAAGCEPVETVAFEDHHYYEAADGERLVELAGERGATGFVTTEKDAVKLSKALLERLRTVGPVCVVGLEARFVDEAETVRELEARLR